MAYLDSGQMFTIDVLVSTCGNRLNSFIATMPPQIKGVKYLVGHQNYSASKIDKKLLSRGDIEYFALESSGVTKSRNFLLAKSKADIVYFCDDDILLSERFHLILRSAHNKTSAGVITFPIQSETGGLRKKFPASNRYRNRFSILSVGTIEISLKGYAKGLSKFPEDMGAGAEFPIGDEAVFLSGFLDSGEKIYFSHNVICSHPDESSGSRIDVASAYSRGLTLRRVFSYCSFVLVIPFFISRKRLFLVEGSYLKGLNTLFRGLFNMGFKNK